MIDWNLIQKPALLLDEAKARRNIKQMVDKATQHNVMLRPHFKTHQSAMIGEWFREVGVTAVTVSSVDMAVYFAQHGWTDITIAFPVNLREIETINQLAHQINLNLLLDSAIVAQQLDQALTAAVNIWLEIDTGYYRTGLMWDDLARITAVSHSIQQSPNLNLAGLLLHAGNTYAVKGETAVLDIHNQTVTRLQAVQAHLREEGVETAVSIGDTPACSLAPHFDGIDEIRPGNFIFYDVMQAQIDACTLDDIAVVLACPIVGIYPERNQIAIYGGAIHHSKERLQREDGADCYGRIALPTEKGWQITPDNSYLAGISQEHGLIQASPTLLQQAKIGDLLLILPVHSCLTANLMQKYMTLEDVHISMMTTSS